MTSVSLLLLAVVTIPLRNPFWPVGYSGEPEAISDQPRVTVAAPTESAAAEDAKTSVTPETIAAATAAAAARDVSEAQNEERLWIAARKSLAVGSTLTADGQDGARYSVAINGRVYADGDLVSANHEGRRFTWRVKYLTDHRTLKLQRVKSRLLDGKGGGKEHKK